MAHMDRAFILIAESDRQIVQAMKTALHSAGFKKIRHVETMEKLETVLREEPVDLLITESRLRDGVSSPLVRRMRLNDLSDDPFLPVIATVGSPEPDFVRRLVDDGPDDVIAKPFSAKILSDRIRRIVYGRKPFVVTHNYVGPDRRIHSRDEVDPKALPARTFAVPNTLKRRIEGSPSRQVFQDGLAKTIGDMALARIEVQAGAIVYQLDRILPKLSSGQANGTERNALDEVIGLADQIVLGLPGTRYASQDMVLNTLSGLAMAVQSGKQEGLNEDIEQLQKLKRILQRDFKR